MKIIDLFCGCGGISQGFKMAGFSVIYGLDNNKDSIETFARNFPDAEVCQKKIEDLDGCELPEADIIVGGPPCVNFSSSKGSRANVLEGLKLVQAFLRVIHTQKPKYWLMENVPRIGLHLPEHIPLEWIGIDSKGYLDVPVRKLFKISEYGAPQNRERLLIGNFPIPNPTHNTQSSLLEISSSFEAIKTLGDVIDSFPHPESSPDDIDIIDPIYDFKCSVSDLTDHFFDTSMTESESKKIRNAKQNHPYMGMMQFPENLKKPARTIVALQMGRETIVLPTSNGRYRRLTVRECASLQTFPVTFQLAGNTIASRYRQAGNAVPPILTYNIGTEIAEKENLQFPNDYQIDTPKPFKKPNKYISTRVRKIDYSKSRKINFPGKELRGFRIELISNQENSTASWHVKFHQGEGKKNHMILTPSESDIEKMVENSIKNLGKEFTKAYNSCVTDCLNLPDIDGAGLHKYIHDNCGELPEEFLSYIEIIDKYFPADKYKQFDVALSNKLEGLDRKKLRIRLLVSLKIVKVIESKTMLTCLN